jgi:hypothetical protein
MLASETNRRVSRQPITRRRLRGERRPSMLNRRSARTAPDARDLSRASNSDDLDSVDARQGIEIRRGDVSRQSKPAVNPPENRTRRPSRPGVDAAARSEGDPDSQLQLTLDLSDPEPRSYEASASAPAPRERFDATRLLWLAMGVGTVTCPLLLAFQLVFTDPAHGLNVLAVVATMSFGALFATWAFEYWLRRGGAVATQKIPTWALTRHAILVSVGVAAMAVSALNRTASFGLLILVVLTLIVADFVLRRLRIR